MGTVMGIMIALMLVGALVWGHGHGMTGDDRGGPGEETTVENDAQNPCQQPGCTAEGLKKDMNSDTEDR